MQGIGYLVVLLTYFLSISTASAQDTTTYTYDSLGRVTATTTGGGPSNGVSTSSSYDAEGNRTNYSVTDPNALIFSIGNASAVTEGGTLAFTVTRSGTASGTVTVNYATANGTAVAGSDYTAASGTLTFLTTDTIKTIWVATTDDATVESAETVLVNLSGASSGTIMTSQGSGTINDNDGWITLTNNSLVVQAGHTATYGCQLLNYPDFGIYMNWCYLNSGSYSVYTEDLYAGPSSRVLSPGYRMQSNYVLEVGASSYGTH